MRTNISIIIPVHYANASVAEESLDAILKTTDFGGGVELLVVMEGGVLKDWESLMAVVRESRVAATCIKEGGVTSFERAAMAATDYAEGRFVVLAAPWILPSEDGWLTKMIRPLVATPACGICAAEPGASVKLPPNMVRKRVLPTQFCAIPRRLLWPDSVKQNHGDEPFQDLQRHMQKANRPRYSHPGIAFEILDHFEHKPKGSR